MKNRMRWISTVGLLVGMLSVAPARAAGFTVTSTLDRPDLNPGDGVCAAQGGACTLRAAIMEANALVGADIITLPSDLFTLSIANLNGDEDAAVTGDLDVSGKLTITGAGAATTIIQAGTYNGNEIDRVFDVQASVQLALSGVTVRYGEAKYGGGIYNGGTLTLANSTVSDNQAGNIDGGGIYNDGTLTLANSTVSDNTATQDGGGIYNVGTLTLTDSTVSSNTAQYDGGGIGNEGTVTLVSSTIAANRADSDGDGMGTGGGISHSGTNAVTTLKNTLIGNNTQGTGSTASDCATKDSSLTSQGYNLIRSITGCTISGDTTGNITGKDPRLGDLKDNGGPTQTQALIRPVQGPIVSIIGSPAINAGNPAGCTDAAGQPLLTDQRGVARPQGDRCDIGAFELEQAAPTPSPSPEPSPAPEPSPVPEPSPSPEPPVQPEPTVQPSPTPVPGTLTPRGYLPMMLK